MSTHFGLLTAARKPGTSHDASVTSTFFQSLFSVIFSFILCHTFKTCISHQDELISLTFKQLFDHRFPDINFSHPLQLWLSFQQQNHQEFPARESKRRRARLHHVLESHHELSGTEQEHLHCTQIFSRAAHSLTEDDRVSCAEYI